MSALAIAALAASIHAAGPVPGARTLRSLAEEADLVFRGVVLDIQYALSEPTGPESVRIPHTFVTYRVDDVLLGPHPGHTLTLRFIGGLDETRLRYLVASNAPQFDLEDEDMLFVTGNTKSLCPLVRRHEGRLRIIDGQIYTETGRALALEGDGTLRAGKRYNLEQTKTTNVAGRIFTKRFGPGMVDGPSNAISADALKARFIEAAGGLQPAQEFASAKLGMPFEGPDMTPAPRPTPEEDPLPPIDRESEIERRRTGDADQDRERPVKSAK
jgi:hypothetical protein